MAAQGFLARVAGRTKQIFAVDTSAGAADAGKIPALDSGGRLNPNMLPAGIGSNTVVVPASEALTAGKFVNFWADAGALKVRLADNSNGRKADGYVTAAVASAAIATVFPLDTVNASLTGLTAGSEYWLGTAGGVIATPLDPADVSNANKVDQYLGVAKSATELVTDDLGCVIL